MLHPPSQPRVLPRLPLLAACLAAAVVVATTLAVSAALAEPSGSSGFRIAVCHATGSETTPYVAITVSTKAADGERLADHGSHGGDIIPAPESGCPDQPPGHEDPGGEHETVAVCHLTGSETNPVVVIGVAPSAVAAHLEHGDRLPHETHGCDDPPAPAPSGDSGGQQGQQAASGAPAASVIAVTAPSAAVQQVAASRSCASRRSFTIRIRSRRRDPVVRASVVVDGRRVRTLRGARVTAPVRLTGLPRGRFTVRITARTRSGRTLTGVRRYRTCTPRSAVRTIPVL